MARAYGNGFLQRSNCSIFCDPDADFLVALVKYYPRGKRVRYPPLGQQRTNLHGDEGKPRGRNEMISDEIQKLTGEYRSRKQVSSHIQVIKPMVKGDRFSQLI